MGESTWSSISLGLILNAYRLESSGELWKTLGMLIPCPRPISHPWGWASAWVFSKNFLDANRQQEEICPAQFGNFQQPPVKCLSFSGSTGVGACWSTENSSWLFGDQLLKALMSWLSGDPHECPCGVVAVGTAPGTAIHTADALHPSCAVLSSSLEFTFLGFLCLSYIH